MKKTQFEDIYASAFDDSPRWRRWFFEEVVGDNSDADIFLAADSAGRASASALLKEFGFAYAGTVIPSGYISCVATKPEARTRGLASQAVIEALAEARRRGYAFCELIPANRSLYAFYSRFGFADAFYADEERYTSLHDFAGGEGEAVEPVYSIFHEVESRVGCGVIHSEADFRHIMADLEFESGHSVVFIRNGADAACLFAAWNAKRPDSTVVVKSLMADTEETALAALATLRVEAGERHFSVWRPPLSGSKANLRVRGMVRIINPEAVLGALAAAHPGLQTDIRLHDSLFPENAGVYRIADGACVRCDSFSGRPELDVPVSVLASILFSAEKTGDIFGLPTRRPYMALMLDT